MSRNMWMSLCVTLLVSMICLGFISTATATYPFESMEQAAAVKNIKGTAKPEAIDQNTDCDLKIFGAQFTDYIQPPTFMYRNWSTVVANAFELPQNCHYNHVPQPSTKPKSYSSDFLPSISCDWEVFIDVKGNDQNNGSRIAPLATFKRALQLSRSRDNSFVAPCITVNDGIYYLGDQRPSTFGLPNDSQLGAIALTSVDNNLTIRAASGAHPVLSGGSLISNLQWNVYKKLSAGTIMMAKLPNTFDWSSRLHFNELFVDDMHAVRCKYPDGDPFTHGTYANPSGWLSSAKSWVPPLATVASTEIHVQSPSVENTCFPTHQIGVGGVATAWNPPQSFWALANPPGGGGSTYQIPTGVQLGDDIAGRAQNWTDVTTGQVYALHSGLWGSWVFDLRSLNRTNATIMFEKGGYQEARGSDSGSSYFVDFIFEELDAPMEWFVDRSSGTLYYMMNMTLPTTFVASQLPCIISLHGDINSPVSNVTIQGFKFTHIPNTYMRTYSVPSGGDVSIHKGGVIFAQGTEYLNIASNNFTNIGGNSIFVSEYNLNATIVENEFVWLGDNAIVLIGVSDGIDGVSNLNQPTLTNVISNLIHETGAYVKQSSPVMISVCRSTQVIGNAMFNVPRAAINQNDGFHGGANFEGNILFNTVRETSDHGDINSWDRQPYLTDSMGFGPTLHMAFNEIHHNWILANFNAWYPIDHDDGSCYYLDHHNFLVYGGKKNYLGHSKTDHNEIYAYPDVNPYLGPMCINDESEIPNQTGWDERWYDNTCVMYSSNQIYSIDSCKTEFLAAPFTADNQIYTPDPTKIYIPCTTNGQNVQVSWAQWQGQLGQDQGSTTGKSPDVGTIIGWGKSLLMPNAPKVALKEM